MKILLLLLVLAGCSKQEKTAGSIIEPAVSGKEAPTNVPTALGAEWLNFWGENLEDYTGEDGYGPPFIFFTEDALTPLYLGKNKKYKTNYEVFFQEQLELYGRNSRGERIVDREKLIFFKNKYPPY